MFLSYAALQLYGMALTFQKGNTLQSNSSCFPHGTRSWPNPSNKSFPLDLASLNPLFFITPSPQNFLSKPLALSKGGLESFHAMQMLQISLFLP